MKMTLSRKIFSLLLLLTLVLSGCTSVTSQSLDASGFLGDSIIADNCDYGGEIKSVEAVNIYTVKFTLCSPDATFAKKMASPVLAIQDKDFLNAHHGNSTGMTFQMNGTGPFVAVENNPGRPVHLQASSTYWGVPPRVTDYYFDFYTSTMLSDPGEMYTKYDIINSLKPSNFANSVSSSTNFTATSHQMMDVVYIGFNNKIAPMDNVVLRKAIAIGLNLPRLTKFFLPTGSETANQLIPANISPGWSDTVSWYNYQTSLAFNTLQVSGYDFSQTITLAYASSPSINIPSPADLASEIKLELAAVNIKVNLKPMPRGEFEQSVADGKEMMFIDSLHPLYSDGAAYYEIPLLRATARFGEVYPNLQQDLIAVQSQNSINGRQLKFDKLNEDFRDIVPFIPVSYVPQVSYFSNSIRSGNTNTFYENYEDLSTRSLSLNVIGNLRPATLWPADETDIDTFRITRLLYDTLVSDGYGSTGLQSSLADTWESNSDLTEWTFYLRYDIRYTNDAVLDANDVVASFGAIWDESSPNHIGNTGEFKIFKLLFGNLLPES
jgi:peptide/nickel transport system substrate-binding protein